MPLKIKLHAVPHLKGVIYCQNPFSKYSMAVLLHSNKLIRIQSLEASCREQSHVNKYFFTFNLTCVPHHKILNEFILKRISSEIMEAKGYNSMLGRRSGSPASSFSKIVEK